MPQHFLQPVHVARAMLALGALTSMGGCAVFSVTPTLELIKASGTAASYAVTGIPPRSSDTIHHPHDRPDAVCIAFNPDVQMPDLLPAIQTALQGQLVSSRVYEAGTIPTACPIWLHYSAAVEWGTPPWSSDYRSYVAHATLTLKTADGLVLGSSHFEPNGAFEIGKWASTHDKLLPVVKALLSGTDS